jgi:hypothetical protein
MNLFNRSKPVEPAPIQKPRVKTLYLKFRGPNNKVIDITHKGLSRFSPFQYGMHGIITHEFFIGDVHWCYRESDDFILAQYHIEVE